MTNGQQLDECARRIDYIRDGLDNALALRNKFNNPTHRRNASRMAVVYVRELRLYRMRLKFIANGEDYSEQLSRPFIRPKVSHY